MLFSKKITKKFLLYKKLSILGLFRNTQTKFISENINYNMYLAYKEKNINSISINSLFKSIKKIYPLISLLLLKESIFLFVSVDKNDNSFLTKIFYSLIKKLKIYCIYDWGFGLLTNFTRTYYKLFLENKEHLHKLPDIIFFLRIVEKQHYLITEAKNSGALSLGLVDYESSNSIDYPIPSNSSLEYSYFFSRLISKIIININKDSIFTKSYLNVDILKHKKIKRLKFWIQKVKYRR